MQWLCIIARTLYEYYRVQRFYNIATTIYEYYRVQWLYKIARTPYEYYRVPQWLYNIARTLYEYCRVQWLYNYSKNSMRALQSLIYYGLCIFRVHRLWRELETRVWQFESVGSDTSLLQYISLRQYNIMMNQLIDSVQRYSPPSSRLIALLSRMRF